MKTGRLITWLGVAVCVLALGTAGYALYVNYAKRQELTAQLGKAEAALTKRQHALDEVEAQRQHLARQFDAVQQRQKAADADAAQLTQERQDLAAQVTTLTSEHSTQAQQLKQTDEQLARLREEMGTLARAHDTLQAQKRALELAALARDSKALTHAEIDQLSETLVTQEATHQQLAQQLADLSGDYERLAQDRQQLVQGIDAHPPEPGTTWASQLAAWATGLSTREETLASQYKEVGEGYLRIGDYARAAEAFEQSLKLREDPELHTRLAFLYSRFLHQGDLARQHTAQSPTLSSLQPGDASRAQHMPRSSWRLLRDWLTQ